MNERELKNTIQSLLDICDMTDEDCDKIEKELNKKGSTIKD